MKSRDLFLLILSAVFSLPAHAAPTNLFAFDDHTLPFRNNLKLTFEAPQKYAGNPVVAPGPAGSVDAAAVVFYGSVLRLGGKFRMWYRAMSDSRLAGNRALSARLAYAESNDGLRWTKPELGLTEFNGNKRNNLLGMPASLDFSVTEPLACFVLFEPEDLNPAHRYKMAVYGRYFPSSAAPKYPHVDADNVPSTIYPFFSADGLTWTLAVPAPKNQWLDETEAPIRVRNNFEIGGLYKFDGLYYVAGQELSPDIFLSDGSLTRRTMVTHWSGDFMRWSQDKSFSFQRYGYRGVRQSFEEAHEPAAVWNRGNVLLGLYGLWHGAVINSERRMDLGFLVATTGSIFANRSRTTCSFRPAQKSRGIKAASSTGRATKMSATRPSSTTATGVPRAARRFTASAWRSCPGIASRMRQPVMRATAGARANQSITRVPPPCGSMPTVSWKARACGSS
ncbi:MAG: hypothetical protein EXS32_14890 [Opitutus sp.]|nr:hypothetical protein [Opitutus sp.]